MEREREREREREYESYRLRGALTNGIIEETADKSL
jgi:hypothetical protein